MAMTRKQRRLTLIAVCGVVLAVALGLVLYALSSRMTFFNSPTDILAQAPNPDARIRLGGLVLAGSVVREPDGIVRFTVTDGATTVPVVYRGLLPDLFKEGQGVVTEGTMGTNLVFAADTVLARHDENYMPAEVVRALREQGHWEGDGPAGGGAQAAPAPSPVGAP